MSMQRRVSHTMSEPDWPDCNSSNISITIACRMVRKYGSRPPSAKQLMSDFCVSRATAFRWRKAFIESLGAAA